MTISDTSPITLIDQMSRVNDENGIDYSLTTASRSNTDRTYIELSEDGKHFVKADSIVYDTPHATLQETHAGTIDKATIHRLFGRLQPGQALYIQLTNKDLDGSIQHPGAIMVLYLSEKGEELATTMYPNPVDRGGALTLDTEMKGRLHITIMNLHGQVVSVHTASSGPIHLDGKLKAGIYIVSIRDTYGNTVVQQITIK